MSDCIVNEEKRCLIEDVKYLLGGGIRKIEIADDAFCSLLKMSTEELTLHLQKYLVTERWANLVGKPANTTDICLGLTTRSLDYEYDFSIAYSKQIGQQSRGDYELKKDYIDIIDGIQVYEIPAGRLINRVLWETPSDIDQALTQSLAYQNSFGAIGGFGDSYYYTGWGNGAFFNSAYYIAPAFDVMLRAMDVGLKNRMRQSDLTYSITAGPNGTKLLHLYSVPNNGNTIGGRRKAYKCKVWYFYYDTLDMDAEAKNKCIQECNDIIKYPSEIPLNKLDFCDLNDMSKIWVRKYLTAMAKETLGRVRGKFGGALKIPNAEVSMDAETLLAEAKEEKTALVAELQTWLEGLQSDKVLERRAAEATNLNTTLKYVPNGIWAI